MAFNAQVATLYDKLVNGPNILVRRWPNAAAGIKVTAGATPAFSAWVKVLAAAKVSNPEFLTGVYLENVADVGAAEVWLVDIGTGLTGSEISVSSGTATAQGIGSLQYFFKTDVGQAMFEGYVPVNPNVRLIGSPQLNGATAGLITGGKDIYVAVQTAFVPGV